MHHFWAIAILCIVIAHITLPPKGVSPEVAKFWSILASALIACSSSIFAFISGYLGYIIEYPKFYESVPRSKWISGYYIKKIKNVYLPMIVVSCLVVILSKLLLPVPAKLGFSLHFLLEGYHFSLDYLFPVQLLLGHLQAQFWFIPFICFMFLLTPLIFRLDRRTLIYISIFLVILPFILPRQGNMYYKDGIECFIRIVCYHGPFYIFGMVFAQNEEFFIGFIKDNIVSLVALYLTFAIFIIYAQYHPKAENHADFIYYLVYCQKVVETLVLYHICCLIKNKILILDTIARYSFCVYFLHVFVGMNILIIFNNLVWNGSSLAGNLVLSWGCTILSVFVCILIGWLCKKTFGKYSRMILGC